MLPLLDSLISLEIFIELGSYYKFYLYEKDIKHILFSMYTTYFDLLTQLESFKNVVMYIV